MSTYGFILGLAITFAALCAVAIIARACRAVAIADRHVEIAKATGLDPRNDTGAALDAAAQVRKTEQ